MRWGVLCGVFCTSVYVSVRFVQFLAQGKQIMLKLETFSQANQGNEEKICVKFFKGFKKSLLEAFKGRAWCALNESDGFNVTEFLRKVLKFTLRNFKSKFQIYKYVCMELSLTMSRLTTVTKLSNKHFFFESIF